MKSIACQNGPGVSLRARCGITAAACAVLIAISGSVRAGTPLSFTENRGQADAKVLFRADAGATTLWVTRGGIYHQCVQVEASEPSAPGYESPERPVSQLILKSHLVGADTLAAVTGEYPLSHRANFLRGADAAAWHADVPVFVQLRFHGVYPGIDLVVRGDSGNIEYDFYVAPGGDPSQIDIAYENIHSMTVTPAGDLEIVTDFGTLIEKRPMAYVPGEPGATPEPVPCEFRLIGDAAFGFRFPAGFDACRTLVIDPVLVYQDLMDGSGDESAWGLATDAQGYTYVTGETTSWDFPLLDPFQTDQPSTDAFISKFDPTGSVVYSTYLGGKYADVAFGIAAGDDGTAFVCGYTQSPDFPMRGGVQPTPGGGADVFVASLSTDGSDLLYATYLGGSGSDYGRGIAVDPMGRVTVTGYTASANFPLVDAYQPDRPGQDAFVARLNAAGNALDFSTYLGGSGTDGALAVAVDVAGAAVVAGYTYSADFPLESPLTTDRPLVDAFLAAFTVDGRSLTYSSYLGGAGNDYATAVDLDQLGRPWVAGYTYSADFPTHAPVQPTYGGLADGFVVCIDPGVPALEFASFLGGGLDDCPYGIRASATGNIVVTGYTNSVDFPVSPDGHADCPGEDAFAWCLDLATRGVTWSTYIGGSGSDRGHAVAVDPGGCLYIVGRTSSSDFLAATTPASPTFRLLSAIPTGLYDAFVYKTCSTADVEPPLLTCPPGLFEPCGSPEGAVVEFSVTASDDSDPSPVVVCTPASGSLFPVGVTVVYCTATDAAGNMATCAFEVTVEEGRGDVAGTMTASCPAAGITVDAFDAEGVLVAYDVTDEFGQYVLEGLPSGDTYTVSFVPPLGYGGQPGERRVLVACGELVTCDFELDCPSSITDQRTIGFWKHQFGVATGGKGKAQIPADDLCAYLDQIYLHFNTNTINEVLIYQPPVSGLCADKLEVARELVNLKGNESMTARARQQLMALLLNVAAGMLPQTAVISSDGATVSQAITHCDRVIDDPAGDHESAKTICDEINNGRMLPAGCIPLQTENIAYKATLDAFRALRAYPNPFNATIDLEFALPAATEVRLEIYNIAGQRVAVPAAGHLEQGTHRYQWSAAGLASGVYLYKLTAGSFNGSGKILLLK
jgi:hypothetical protein